MTRPSEAEVTEAFYRRDFFEVLCPDGGYVGDFVTREYAEAFAAGRKGFEVVASTFTRRAALSTPPLPSAEPVRDDDCGDGMTWADVCKEVGRKLADAGEYGLRTAFIRRTFNTTPPAAAQDTGRLDWLEENGGRISGPADDSPRFVIWGDTDAQDVQGETLREAIDNAMDAARAAGGE